MTALQAEAKRLNDDLVRMLWKGGSYASEIPIRIHERGTDSGHGLGGPPLHPRFIAYLKDAGVCMCDEFDAMNNLRPHICDKRFVDRPARFRESDKARHPRRLKRALRQLRLICPAEFDVVYLMVARGRSWTAALDQINSSRYARGEDLYTQEDFVVLMVSGFSKLVDSW
jgi:hypothetical protein